MQISHWYHADNGRFAEWAFLSHCDSKGQTVSFANVNAHHQNGIVAGEPYPGPAGHGKDDVVPCEEEVANDASSMALATLYEQQMTFLF